jgi:hypothetical protein
MALTTTWTQALPSAAPSVAYARSTDALPRRATRRMISSTAALRAV